MLDYRAYLLSITRFLADNENYQVSLMRASSFAAIIADNVKYR